MARTFAAAVPFTEQSEKPISRTTAPALLLVAAPYLVLAAFAALAFRHTVDDAFISFRYAQNLASGHGLVFNPGERVEGYSNPLWVYLLAIPAWAGLDLVVAAKLLGVAAAFGSIYAFGRVLERLAVAPRVQTLAMLVFAGQCSLVYYAVAGLETVLYAGFILLLHAALLERRGTLAAAAVGAASICRPEGAVLFAPLVLGLLASERPRRALQPLALALAILGAQLAFRRVYYGSWVPNTFHAKAYPSVDLLKEVADRTEDFITGTLAWARQQLAFGVLAVLGGVGMIRAWRAHPPMLASIAALSFFVWYAVPDWMSFGRFYLPFLPLLLAYAFIALGELGARWTTPAFAAVAAGLILVTWGGSLRELERFEDGRSHSPAMSGRNYEDAAAFIRSIAEPDDVLAAPEIGVVAYRTGLRTIDILGLTDPKITQLLGSPQLWDDLSQAQLAPYAEYILGQRPRFVLLNFEAGFPDRLEPMMRSLYTRISANDAYTRARSYRLSARRELVVFVATREAPGAPCE